MLQLEGFLQRVYNDELCRGYLPADLLTVTLIVVQFSIGMCYQAGRKTYANLH
jgi:hypothetical protein